MKFQLAINMGRLTPDLDMTDVERHTLEMVQMADDGGFAIAWAAHTSRIRLGVGSAVGCSGILAPHQGSRRGGAAGSLQRRAT